jgi:hypothetical protein
MPSTAPSYVHVSGPGTRQTSAAIPSLAFARAGAAGRHTATDLAATDPASAISNPVFSVRSGSP